MMLYTQVEQEGQIGGGRTGQVCGREARNGVRQVGEEQESDSQLLNVVHPTRQGYLFFVTSLLQQALQSAAHL